MPTPILQNNKSQEKQVILVYGEGKGEVMFLKHLYKLYKPRHSGVRVIFRHYREDHRSML